MKRAVRFTALLLAILCTVQFFSCGQTGDSGETVTTVGGETTTDTESVGTEYPELEAEDFGGAEITFLVVEPNEVNNIIENTKLLLDLLEGAQPMLEFEPSIFKSMVKQITVYPERFCFHLANGLTLDKGR